MEFNQANFHKRVMRLATLCSFLTWFEAEHFVECWEAMKEIEEEEHEELTGLANLNDAHEPF